MGSIIRVHADMQMWPCARHGGSKVLVWQGTAPAPGPGSSLFSLELQLGKQGFVLRRNCNSLRNEYAEFVVFVVELVIKLRGFCFSQRLIWCVSFFLLWCYLRKPYRLCFRAHLEQVASELRYYQGTDTFKRLFSWQIWRSSVFCGDAMMLSVGVCLAGHAAGSRSTCTRTPGLLSGAFPSIQRPLST